MTAYLSRSKFWLTRMAAVLGVGIVVGAVLGGALGFLQMDPSSAKESAAYAPRLQSLRQRADLARQLARALLGGRHDDFGRLLGSADWNALQHEVISQGKTGELNPSLQAGSDYVQRVARIDKIDGAVAKKHFDELAQLLGYRDWNGVQHNFIRHLDGTGAPGESSYFSAREAYAAATALESVGEDDLRHAAHMEVVTSGCEGCGRRTWEWGGAGAMLGATVLGVVPAAFSLWFLFLHMLSEISASVRGDKR